MRRVGKQTRTPEHAALLRQQIAVIKAETSRNIAAVNDRAQIRQAAEEAMSTVESALRGWQESTPTPGRTLIQ